MDVQEAETGAKLYLAWHCDPEAFAYDETHPSYIAWQEWCAEHTVEERMIVSRVALIGLDRGRGK